MHQHRRRKKKPSYGIRTIEISRGKNGFGFTISGQAPCILSCIINGSPAEKAGLRPGDFLVAVNNQSVSKAPHDDVVRLIGNSSGVLKLQIAENYYSDSSEEEFISIVKFRPKYLNKARNKQQQSSVTRAEKVVHDLQTGALFVDHLHGCSEDLRKQRETRNQTIGSAGPSKSKNLLTDLFLKQRIKSANCSQYFDDALLQQNISSSACKNKKSCLKNQNQNYSEFLNISNSSCKIFHSIFTEQDLNNILYPEIFTSQTTEEIKKYEKQAVLKAVVGYLGTIEMPKEQQLPNSRLQTIRNCIRRLRVEKKVHTLVLMTVFPQSIILINPQGVTLAEFSAERITFSGVYSDDKKFFGLVTDHGISCDDFCEVNPDNPGSVSSSCHVFMVDPKMAPHHQHTKRAKAFHIVCTLDPVTNKCKEFPESADSILQAVVSLYRNKLILNDDVVQELEFHVNLSPQPSNTSSNSSNSDSGIGFRDEGIASDQVFFIDVDNYHQYSTNSLDRQAFSTSGFAKIDTPIRYFSVSHDRSHTTNNSQSTESKISGKECFLFDRLTVRAMPDPVGFQKNCINQSDYYEQPIFHDVNDYNLIQMNSVNSNSIKDFPGVQQIDDICDDNILEENSKNHGLNFVKFKRNKLSPKVYEVNIPVDDEVQLSNSSEDLWDFRSCSTEESQHQSKYSKFKTSQDTTELVEFSNPDDNVEDESESNIIRVKHCLELSQKSVKRSSFFRRMGRNCSLRGEHETGTMSDGELAIGKTSLSDSMLAIDQLSDSSHHSSSISERPIDVGRVGSWTAGFNVLLEDPAGLHTFSEFLKKEFSQENITFWIACEHFRQLKDESLLFEKANEIFSKHLCIGASEPVNVDSHARQIAQEGLDSPTTDLFIPAQKQIFNLMKFDCYQRFLKSPMFKECMLREVQGEPLLYPGHMQEMNKPTNKRKKVSTMLKKRKSLIPWHKRN